MIASLNEDASITACGQKCEGAKYRFPDVA
jgi:hypothetical protein